MTQQEQKDWTENVRWADDRQALLDDFAKAAMQGMVSGDVVSSSYQTILATAAYDIATAMMQERERRMKG